MASITLTPNQLRAAHKAALNEAREPKKSIQTTIKPIRQSTKASDESTASTTKIKPLFTRALAERSTGKIVVFKKAFGSTYE